MMADYAAHERHEELATNDAADGNAASRKGCAWWAQASIQD
jgi:hypothetical protein